MNFLRALNTPQSRKLLRRFGLITTTAGVSFTLASDYLQIEYMTYRMKDVKLADPTPSLPRKTSAIEISRADELNKLCHVIPSNVNAGWVLMGNPPGYGKTYLISKWTSKREEHHKLGYYATNGPVLRVDFASARSADHANRLLVGAFAPYMFNPYFYLFFLGSHQPVLTFDEKLGIIRKCCAVLADAGTPVVLIMDSVSTLVNAANSPGEHGQEMAGFIRTLFDLNEVLVCVPVASSATTVVSLQKSNPHVFFRTTPYHPPFVSDRSKLKYFLEQLLVDSGVVYTEDDIVSAVQYFGGSLVTYTELVNRAKQYASFNKAFAWFKEQHLNNVRKIIFFDEDDTVSDKQRALGLRCHEKLKLASKQNKTEKDHSDLRVYTDAAVQHLLRTPDPSLPLVGISAESSGLVLSWPGTAEVVAQLEPRAQELRAQYLKDQHQQ